MAANAMQTLPNLPPEAREILEVIVRNGAIDGSNLIKYMGKTRRDEIVKSLRDLESLDLIEVGGLITQEDLPFARFAVRPSAKEYLHRMLRFLK